MRKNWRREVFSLWRRKVSQGNLITIFLYLKGSYKEDGGFLFTRSNVEMAKGNRFQDRFHVDVRKKIFRVKQSITTSLRTWVPITGGFEDTTGKVISKSHLDSLFCKTLNEVILQRPSNLGCHMVLSHSVRVFCYVCFYRVVVRDIWYSTHLHSFMPS